MRLLHPEWLLLIIPWILLLLHSTGAFLRTPRRILLMALTLLLIAEPVMRRIPAGLDLWVLFDCSKSITSEFRKQMVEWSRLLEQSKGSADRLTFIPFAKEVYESSEAGWSYDGDDSETRIGLALRTVLDRLRPENASRILIFSDGYSTDTLREMEREFVRREISVDSRILESRIDEDTRVQNFQLPAKASPEENYLISFQIFGKQGTLIPYRMTRNGEVVYQGSVEMKSPVENVRLSDRSSRQGMAFYEVILDLPQDPVPQNNHATGCIAVEGNPKILLLSGFADDPIAHTLRKQGFNVDLMTVGKNLSDHLLPFYQAIWIHQFPAEAASLDFWRSIDFQVRYQGTGLVMVGGRRSFAAGGFFSSPIGDLLPVSMELRKDHRKLGTSLAIALDRSGSMGASVGKLTKMDLANDAVVRSIEMLGDDDLIAVFAVDTEAHAVVDMTLLGEHKKKICQTIRRIQSGGGGIFVYEALKAGWTELQKISYGQRHMILFADAADSEMPGEYQKLLKEMTSKNVTVSVIGMGNEKDKDADLLKDVAKLGKGRIFFGDNAMDLPALFTQETVAFSRAAFIEEPTHVSTTANWLQISNKAIAPPNQVRGYNLNYLREGASGVFFSEDTYKAPLFSFWNRGAGRTAAVAFPMAGEEARSILEWPMYGEFSATLTRWLMGGEVPKGIRLKTSTEGLDILLDLFYDDSWTPKVAAHPPKLHWIQQGNASVMGKEWEKMKPGHFSTRMRIEPGKAARGSVEVGGTALAFGPFFVHSDVEWDFSPQRRHEFKSLITKTGGVERLDLTSIWKSPRQTQPISVREWFWCFWIGLFLWDAYRTRIQKTIHRRGR